MGVFLTYYLVFAFAETGQFGLDNATHPGLRPPLSERGWRGSGTLTIMGE